MPIYDYLCSTCGHGIEVMHSVHGHGPTTCTECGGPMKKAITAAAVHFKGSGWARKDRSDATRSARATTKEPDKVAGGASGSPSTEPSPTSESSTAATAPAPKPESAGQAPD